MSDKRKIKLDLAHGPTLVVLSIVLELVAGLMFWVGLMLLAQGQTQDVQPNVSVILGVLLETSSFVAAFVGGLGLLVGLGRWALLPYQAQALAKQEQMLQVLNDIHQSTCLSEGSRRILYRQNDLQVVRQAIEEEIRKGDYDMALNLVSQMSGSLGDSSESQQLRNAILTSKNTQSHQKLDNEFARVDELLTQHNWEQASKEAQRIETAYAHVPSAQKQNQKVTDARERYKHDLERRFLETASRGDVEAGLDLLKELDHYLSPKEAANFREAARSVLTKKRENLAVQFKLAVHDKDWKEAIRVGQDILNDFPNSKMAQEVGTMIQEMRQRADASPA